MASKTFSRLDKTPPIDLEFQDLSYFIQAGRGKLQTKQILKSVSGIFNSGELTGILGGSGAGKTTLLNILAGYVVKGFQGAIKINGVPRQTKVFHKLSTYIMQEDLIQPFLTVEEEITIAAKLKLGNEVAAKDKELIVYEVLNLLGLSHSLDTMVEQLSGGERRRLSIALELVSNPPIIFLDEPTSGLDSVAITQVIDVLRTLTGEGRTVICTIHQPSAATMRQFHQVYFLANGLCVYNGSPSNILPFLNSIQLECPTTYSHQEFLIETVEITPKTIPIISKAINNGKLNFKDCDTPSINKQTLNVQTKNTQLQLSFSTSFLTQFSLLYYRMMLQQSRNKGSLMVQLISHVVCAILMGTLYYDIGNDALQAFTILKMCLCIGIFYVYNYTMTPLLLFPSEVKILKREYFNLWYGLKPYYLALTIRTLPMMLILGLLNVTIIYFMSGQPLESNRFFSIFLACMMLAVTSEGLGLAIGSTFNTTNGSIFGPAVISPMVFLMVYGLDYRLTISPIMKIVRGTSYVRNGVVALIIAIFQNREHFECNEDDYCHFTNPSQLLKDFGMGTTTFGMELVGVTGFLIIFRSMAYLVLRYRVTPDFGYTFVNFILKIVTQRANTDTAKY